MSQSYWSDPFFVFWYILASVLGLALNFSMLYCTDHNSALTTSVLGCLKNIIVTYCGMVGFSRQTRRGSLVCAARGSAPHVRAGHPAGF